MTYFGIGGTVSDFEVDAYPHHCLVLPALQRNLLAQAANEILTDLAPPQAPYAADLAQGHTAPARDGDVLDHDDPGATGRLRPTTSTDRTPSTRSPAVLIEPKRRRRP